MKNIFKYAFLAFSITFISQSAFALTCKDASDYSANKVISIPNDIYISRGDMAESGRLIWRSEDFTVTIICVDDSDTPAGEAAVMYFDPDSILSGGALDSSLGFGVTMKSINYPVGAGSTSVGQATALPSNKENCSAYWNTSQKDVCATPQKLTITFAAYIYSTGIKPSSNTINYNSNVPLFQIDSVQGLNRTPGASYRALISNLGKIKIVDCNPLVTIEGNRGSTVDFGYISSSSAVAGGIAKTVPFNVRVDLTGENAGSECTNQSMVASFSTSYNVKDNITIIPQSGSVDSNFGIIINNVETSTPVQLNASIPLNVSSNSIVKHPFSASLKWDNDSPTLGTFNAMANVHVTFR